MAQLSIRILEADPGLAEGMDDGARRVAERAVLAPLWHFPPGPLDTTEFERGAFTPSLLIVSGLLSCSVDYDHTRITELAGPGDMLRPNPLPASAILTHAQSVWHAHEEGASAALLGEAFLPHLAMYPSIAVAIADRLSARGETLIRQMAISHVRRLDERIELALRLLSERFGRVTPAGVRLDLPLTHQLLGEIVGARRPSVTAALGALRESGRLTRDAEGRYVLAPDPPGGHAAAA